MKNLNLILAQVISTLRHNANISQEELANRACIHRTYVSQIERGLKSPTLQVLMQIAVALNTSTSEILQNIEKQINEL
jgi:transcriptional regulator with XRE-family HTH domain